MGPFLFRPAEHSRTCRWRDERRCWIRFDCDSSRPWTIVDGCPGHFIACGLLSNSGNLDRFTSCYTRRTADPRAEPDSGRFLRDRPLSKWRAARSDHSGNHGGPSRRPKTERRYQPLLPVPIRSSCIIFATWGGTGRMPIPKRPPRSASPIGRSLKGGGIPTVGRPREAESKARR